MPYKSLLLCSVPAGVQLTQLTLELCTQVSGLIAALPHTNVSAITTTPRQAGLSVSFFDYDVQKQVAWTTAVKRDTLHHLVVVCRLRRRLAILMTDSTFRDRIVHLVGSQDGTALGRIRVINRGTLNAAFVQGKTKTLWLANTRRGALASVDSKIIAGDDLQFALDPLIDQSFLFSAVRCVPPLAVFDQAIGVSPRKSAIWAGPSNDFPSFCASVAHLLEAVEAVVAPVDDPLPVLATALHDIVSLGNVAGAFDAAITPMELLDTTLPAADFVYAERWSKLSFTVVSQPGPNLTAEIAMSDAAGVSHPIGAIQINFDISLPESIHVAATPVPAAVVHHAALLAEAIEMINRKPSWLRVWYQSGHGFSDGAFSLSRLRDQPFPYSWGDFAGFNVGKEKPLPAPAVPAMIGAQDSLFCWVRTRWWSNPNPLLPPTGWLACNDGTRELADFIHLDIPAGNPAVLSLIHVKASDNTDPARPIALGDFEIVVSQAEKNLRFIEMKRLADEFVNFLDHNLFDAVWHNGVADTRANMLAALQAAPLFPRVRVIVIQPRVTQTAVNAARPAAVGTIAHRAIHQLDTLLLSAAATCRGIGAEFQVIGDVI
jgi:hypothetical protein